MARFYRNRILGGYMHGKKAFGKETKDVSELFIDLLPQQYKPVDHIVSYDSVKFILENDVTASVNSAGGVIFRNDIKKRVVMCSVDNTEKVINALYKCI